jgi:hypothetical protein
MRNTLLVFSRLKKTSRAINFTPSSFCQPPQPALHSFLQHALRYEWLQCFL